MRRLEKTEDSRPRRKILFQLYPSLKSTKSFAEELKKKKRGVRVQRGWTRGMLGYHTWDEKISNVVKFEIEIKHTENHKKIPLLFPMPDI